MILLTSCTSKKPNSFSISGKIDSLNTNFIVLSKIDNLQKKSTIIIDTLKVNIKGVFNSVYFLEPNIYNLTFDKKTIQLAIDKGQNITINGTSTTNLNVTGSFDTQLLNAYELFRKESLNRLVTSVRIEIKSLQKDTINHIKINTLRELEVTNYKKHQDELIDFVKENMGTSIAIYATSLRWNGDRNLSFLQELISNFEEEHPNLEVTQKLKNKLLLLKKTSVGSTITNIKMPNSQHKIVNLDSVKGKYTLIDFWASWCPPCRTESVLLNELYTSYNSKGFEIYGISLDSKKERWLKALKQDNRIWTEVSTLEGFNTAISQEYGITSLPTNFLINASGEIIAVNIHGKELKEKIMELLSN
ncbi:MAG: TlpA disulfide reductase family protein [Lutibacter sp.]|uniref:TlpA family protein disulfide reductase n=1 Tax=Lutibacter sp. TaxID=1925666 RepID=UPI00385C4438